MSERTYTLEDMRDFVETLTHAAIVTQGSAVVAVNDAWLRKLGHARADVVGASFESFVAAEERTRLAARAALPREARKPAEDGLLTLIMTGRGEPLPVHVYPAWYAAREGRDFCVSNTFVDAREARELDLEGQLLRMSTELRGASSEKEVRSRVLASLARGGFWGAFWSARGDGTTLPTAEGTRARDDLALQALGKQQPVFDGPRTSAPECVYLPVGAGEVLVVGGSVVAADTYSLSFFARLLAHALVDAREAEAARHKLAGTQLLLELARTTSETLDLDAVLGVTADSLVQLLDVSNCFVMLYDERTRTLRGNASSSEHRHHVHSIDISLDDPSSLAARAARERRPIAIPDTRVDAYARASPRVRALGEKAIVVFPLLSRGRLEGVVVLDDIRAPHEFSAEWMERATAMVAQVALSIANARLYESLRKSYAELAETRAEMVKRERLAALGELAAVVAHEVRNPLGVIYNATSSLKRIVEESPDGLTLLDIVGEECSRLNQIVGDLIDFARPRQLSMQPEDVGRIVREAVESVASQPDAPLVRFETRLDPALPTLTIDRRLIRQAIANVAMNAIQSMPRGGKVELRASFDQAASALSIEVTDDGPGIPDDVMPRIFEPFYTTKAKGAGLGLAVVKRIIEDHGGHVTVRSARGRGTTFVFELPVEADRAAVGTA